MKKKIQLAGVLLCVLTVLTVFAPTADLRGEEGTISWVLPRGREDVILSLVAPHSTQAPVEPGTWFERISLTNSGIDFVVVGREPPAGPVTIRVRWTTTTAGVYERPRIEISVDGLDDATPENLRCSVETLRGAIATRLTDDVVVDLLRPLVGPYIGASGSWLSWLRPVKAMAPGLGDLDQEAMGITQVQWAAVFETAPEAPSPAWIVLFLVPVLGLGLVGLLRLPRGGRGWEAAWGVLLPLGAVAAWWLTEDMSKEGLSATIRSAAELGYLVPTHRDFAVAAAFLAVALAGTIAAALVRGAGVFRKGRVRGLPWGEAAIVMGLVAGSLLVRFGMGGRELLTDGGSGFERLLQYNFGYGGVSILISWLFPASLEGLVWPAIMVTSMVAALAPVALYALARELDLGRGAALAGAGALACWPLHAALFTSDFLQGPILTIGLFGVGLVARASRTDRPGWLLAGAAVLGGLIWMRPDAMIWGLPFAAAAMSQLWSWRSRGALWLALGWGTFAMACRLLSYAQHPGIIPEGGGNDLTLFLEGFILAGHAALPWWLWIGLPVGLWVIRDRPALVVLIVAGALAADLSLKVGGSPPDLLEFFRYLAPAMGWTALVAGVGLARLVALAPEGMGRRVAAAGVAVGLMVIPVVHGSYLATSYAPRVSDQVFREVLRILPADAGVIVPGEVRRDGLDPSPRYRYIAWEEFETLRDSIPGNRVLSAAELVSFVRIEGRLPRLEDLDLAFGGQDSGDLRWFYLRTGECLNSMGFDPEAARDPGTCRAMEEVLDLETVETFPAPYRNHRLVTQPRERRPPKYDDDSEIVLYRVRGLRTQFHLHSTR